MRAVVGEMVEGFRRNDLLTYASAIAFQVLYALVPFLLFAVGLLGFLHLSEVWKDNVAPDVKAHVSHAAFTVIDSTVNKVLGRKQLFWVTAGAGLTVWEISGAVRAVMGALDGVYRADERRSFREKLPTSLALSVAVGLLVLAAATVVRFVPLLFDDVSGVAAVLFFLGRWALAAVLLGVAVGLLVRYAPATRQPLPWVSFGTVLVIFGWVAMSIGFGLYLTEIASYQSVFGHLATLFVLIGYLYLASVVFLGGVQLDAVVRARVEHAGSGD
jgi:membrane protein